MAHPMLSPPPSGGHVPELRGVLPKPAKPRWFKPILMSLPAQVRYFLSLIAFWPTAAIARIFAWAMPQKRRVWDRVDEHVILGAAPFFRSELEDLYHKQRVRGIVNMCREWNYHVDWVRPYVVTKQQRTAVTACPGIRRSSHRRQCEPRP